MIAIVQVSKIANGFIVQTPSEQSVLTKEIKPGMEIYCQDEVAVASVVKSQVMKSMMEEGTKNKLTIAFDDRVKESGDK